MSAKLQVQIVTYNSEDAIADCLDALLAQSLLPSRIMIIDNASIDQTKRVIESYQSLFHEKKIILETIFLPANTGYAAAHNKGIQAALADQFDFICTLNPDVRLESNYLKYTTSDFRLDAAIGGVTGRLLRPQSASSKTIIDSAGLQMEAFYHVRDRGQEEVDRGQYDEPAYVWGVCGAAALYRKEMLEELVYQGKCFDESFFLYKEDVDLCWRGNARGWKFYYEPRAIAWHERGWKKGVQVTSQAQIHSFANQIALLIKHVSGISPMLLLSILIEMVRWIGIAIRSPGIASSIQRKIRAEWSNNWSWRRAVQ